MKPLRDLVIQGRNQEAAERVEQLLDRGATPDALMKEAMIAAMDVVGEQFQKGEIYLPEMLMAARAMKAGMAVLKPRIVPGQLTAVGRVVLGTVRGDMHDIGKNLVSMGLEGAGFEVIDLGIDVSPERFVDAVREHEPQVVGLSALLTTTMLSMQDTLQALADAGLRDRVRVMIGGAPVTREYADEIGADFYGPDSTAGKDFARQVVASIHFIKEC
jgi:5-methyltetrahydrofolate--homocysteine methyltransferase